MKIVSKMQNGDIIDIDFQIEIFDIRILIKLSAGRDVYFDQLFVHPSLEVITKDISDSFFKQFKDMDGFDVNSTLEEVFEIMVDGINKD